MIDHSDTLSASQRYALGVEYDGSQFHGWQVQSGVSTVQESLERALGRVASHPVRVITAGRTDTGVHASGQVVHFDSHSDRPLKAWSRGTNTLTPPGLVVTWAIPVSAGFHARFSVLKLPMDALTPELAALLKSVRHFFTRPTNLERGTPALNMTTICKVQERLLCKYYLCFIVRDSLSLF